jgi:hypothetical protein
MTTTCAAGALLFSIAVVGCARPGPAPTAGAEAGPTSSAVAIDSGGASAQPVSAPATDRGDAALAAPSARGPSLTWLRDLAAGREDVRSVIDEEEGVAFVEVGTSYNPETGKTEELKTAKKWCGPKVAADVEQQLRAALINVHSDDQMVCKGLSCIHEASGEWDGQVRLELARKKGRLILVAIERVLDVPLRAGADKDMVWAREQRTRLVKERCH